MYLRIAYIPTVRTGIFYLFPSTARENEEYRWVDGLRVATLNNLERKELLYHNQFV